MHKLIDLKNHENMHISKIYKKSYRDKNGCWRFIGSHCNCYANTSINGKSTKIPRAVMIILTDKEVTKLDFCCHKCNNKWCINPNHMYWGNRSTNTKDMFFAGVLNLIHQNTNGVKNSRSKFTEDQIKEIRLLNKTHGLGPSSISKKFGYNKNSVNNILYRSNSYKGV